MTRAPSSARLARRAMAVLAAAALALAACGDDDTDSSVPADSTATSTAGSTVPGGATDADTDDEVAAGPSYTIVSGDTLSGIAGRAGVPLADLIAVNGWAEGTDHVIVPGDVIVLPAGATVPAARTTTTTAASNSGNSGSGSGSGNSSSSSGSGSGNSGSGSGSGTSGSGTAAGHYTRTSPRYSEEDSLEIAHPLSDGEYGAEATSDGTIITFVLFRYLSWETCAAGLSDDEAAVSCASPPLSENGDGTTLTVVGADLDEATVIDGFDLNQSWSIDGAELTRLLVGEAPAGDAPSGFQFVPEYAYRIIVDNGEVVAAHQQFHS